MLTVTNEKKPRRGYNETKIALCFALHNNNMLIPLSTECKMCIGATNNSWEYYHVSYISCLCTDLLSLNNDA